MDEPAVGDEGPLRADPGDLALGPDCRASLAELYRFLDGQLTAERLKLIRAHLESCTPCLEAYDFEADLRLIVSSCCKERQVPPGLRERIAVALEELRDER